jgi:hypothetical protein
VREARELFCLEALNVAMPRLGKTAAGVERDKKAALWKVAVAAQLKSVSTESNVWLAKQLWMDAPDGKPVRSASVSGEPRCRQRMEAERFMRESADSRV